MARFVSEAVTVLGLVSLAVVAAVIGFSVASHYVLRSVGVAPEISVSYARLTYITDNEFVNTVQCVTFRGEMGIANPGQPTSATVCVISMNLTRTGGTTKPVDVVLSSSCTTINIRSGYGVYSFIIRVPRYVMESIGCRASYASCPYLRDWYLALYVGNERVAVVKPVYTVPT